MKLSDRMILVLGRNGDLHLHLKWGIWHAELYYKDTAFSTKNALACGYDEHRDLAIKKAFDRLTERIWSVCEQVERLS